MYKDEAYNLEDRKNSKVGLTKVNTAFKGDGCEAGRGYTDLNQVEREWATQVLKMWKRPEKPKTFKELRSINSHDKKDYFENILF